jgi:hypothetical protein
MVVTVFQERRCSRMSWLLPLGGDGRGVCFDLLCPSDISPKYDNGNSGCEFLVWLVEFGGDSTMGFLLRHEIFIPFWVYR